MVTLPQAIINADGSFEVFREPRSFIVNGIEHPASAWSLWGLADWEGFGITLAPVVDAPLPDQDQVVLIGPAAPVYANGVVTFGWQTTPRDPAEVAAIAKERANAPIQRQLDELDRKSIRALREGDQARISAIEAEAATLRAQLVK